MTVHHRQRAGFSVIEILVFVTILVILAGAAVPVATKMLQSATRKTTREELMVLSEAALEYYRDTEALPARIADLEIEPSGVPGWAGPYLASSSRGPDAGTADYRTDAWSRPYVLSGTDTLAITSLGSSGELDDGDDISIELDFTPVRREKTLDKLRIINQAIVLYNGIHQVTKPLPADFKAALRTLVDRKFLPDYDTYLQDAWGEVFVADPAGLPPLVRVQSTAFNGRASSSARRHAKQQ